jgi:hypothetical protein
MQRATDIVGKEIAKLLTLIPRLGGRLEVKEREVEGQRAARAASAPICVRVCLCMWE